MKIHITTMIFLGLISIISLPILTGCVDNSPLSPAIIPPTTTPGNITIPPEKERKVTLIVGGYGYEVGDIVLLDSLKQPAVGDIVQYNWSKNKSDCMAMGAGVYLARIIGLPGDRVSFQQTTYEANGFKADMGRDVRTMWGNEKYDQGVFDRELNVPDNEFLADKWIGLECQGKDGSGSSIAYSRYTIKREAITGVVVKKTGHDKEFEEQQKKVVY
jgi:hypothetical protein